MSYVWAHGKDLDDINNAIKSITDSQTDYEIDEMAAAIDSISEINSIESFLAKNIIHINLPAITIVGERSFQNCHSLTTINLPNVTSIYQSAFESCDSLTTVNLPNVISIEENGFKNCHSLTTINLPKVTSIGGHVFDGCGFLDTIILAGSIVCTLGTDAFNGTKIHSNSGYIYVPGNLVDTYRSATNWSTYANQIMPIPSE